MTTPGIFGENIFLTGKYNETLAIQDNFSTTSVSIPRTLFIGSGNDTFLVYGNIINRGLKITTTDYTRFDSFTITFSIKPLTFNVRLYKYIGGSNSTKYETNELINQSFTYDPPISNTPVTFNFTSSPVLYPGTYAIVLFSTSDTSINVSARIRFLDTNLPSTFISGTYTVNESILAINGNTTTEDLNRWYLFYDPVFRDISGVSFKELTANNITFNTLGNTLFNNNIGIGTTSPTRKLHIQSAGDTYMRVHNSTANVGCLFGLGSANTELWTNVVAGDTGWTQQITLQNSSGNLGIGTTTPQEKLDVAGNICMSPSSRTTGCIVKHQDSASSTAYASINMLAGGTNNFNGVITFNTKLGGLFNSPLGERMRIHTNGNVGIGVADPQFQLQLSDFAMSQFGYYTGTQANHWIMTRQTAPSPEQLIIRHNSTSNGVRINTNGSVISLNTPMLITYQRLRTSDLTLSTDTFTDIGNFTVNYIDTSGISTSSIIVIQASCHYSLTGSGDDSWATRVLVAGTEIYRQQQNFVNAGGGGTRSTSLLPIQTYSLITTNTNGTVNIQIQAARISSNDNTTFFGSSGSSGGYFIVYQIPV